MAQTTVLYNDPMNQRLMYNDYINTASGSAERRVWVAPVNPYVIQRPTDGGVTNSNIFSPEEVSVRIASKYQPYLTKLKTSDVQTIMMVYGPIKGRTIASSGLGIDGDNGGPVGAAGGCCSNNVILSSSMSNYSEITAPTSYALTKFYEDFVGFRNKMESLSNLLPAMIESMCCNGGGGGVVEKDPYEPIINESEMAYDTVNEFLGRVNVLGPLVCSSGIHFRNYSFKFMVPDNTLVIPNAFIAFSKVDDQLPVSTITNQGYTAPVAGYYHFDVILRLKILQVTTRNYTALQTMLVRSVPGVTMFNPSSPPPGTNVVASYMSPFMGDGIGYPIEDTCTIQCKTWMNRGDLVRIYIVGPTNKVIYSDAGNNDSLSMWTGALISR
jgi:hypothetical protein